MNTLDATETVCQAVFGPYDAASYHQWRFAGGELPPMHGNENTEQYTLLRAYTRTPNSEDGTDGD